MAHYYNLTHRALRFYEERGLLAPRIEANSRVYVAKDRIRVELILKGKRLGFSLREIAELIDRSPRVAKERAPVEFSLRRDQIEAQVAALKRRRHEIDLAIDTLLKALEKEPPIADFGESEGAEST